jgi:hypothetical protein
MSSGGSANSAIFMMAGFFTMKERERREFMCLPPLSKPCLQAQIPKNRIAARPLFLLD